MDKRVIFAVAGSGKTTYIVDSLSRDKRSLIVTIQLEITITFVVKFLKSSMAIGLKIFGSWDILRSCIDFAISPF